MPASDTKKQGFALTQTKLHRPRLPEDLVSRPRLRARLDRGLGRNLILVSAPAGFGKTTLLAEWLADCPHPVAWLRLDKGDSDLNAFAGCLMAAIESVYPNTCRETYALLQAPQTPSPGRFATTFSNETVSLPGELVLVLDDYQAIQDETVQELLTTLIPNLPPQLHLVIATRQDPGLPLARYRVRRKMIELRAEDLCFSRDEAQAFLERAVGAALDRATIATLEERTEGWIAGLRLAALSLHGAADPAAVATSFRGSSHLVMDYLVDEALSSQPAHVQSFLARTSILDRFCAPLCDALLEGQPIGDGSPGMAATAPPPARQLLEVLDRANLFLVALDGEKVWHRYHPLFQQMLQSRLQAEHSQKEIATLHLRASAWLADQGFADEALAHVLAAGDVMMAAQIVENNIQDLMNCEAWSTLERWLRMLPKDVVQQRPALLLAEAYLLHSQFNLAAVQPFLDKAETLLDSGTVTEEIAEGVLRGQIDAFRGEHSYWQGNPERSLELAHRALAYLPRGYSNTRSIAIAYAGLAHQMMGQVGEAERFLNQTLNTEARDDAFLATGILATLCVIHMRSAKLFRLDQVSRHLAELAEENGVVGAAGWGHYWQGRVKYEWNDLDAAADHFLRVLQERHKVHSIAVHYSMLWLTQVYQAQGRLIEADQMLEACLRFALESNNSLHQIEANAIRARLSLLRGDAEPAVRWLQQDASMAASPVLSMSPGIPCLTEAKILIAQDIPDSLQAADELLERVLSRARAQHNTWRTIEALALQALVHGARAQEEQALAILEQAVTLARPVASIRTFADLGPTMGDLLSQLAQRGVTPEYLNRVLDAFPGCKKVDLQAGTQSRMERTPAPSPVVAPSRALPGEPSILVVEDDDDISGLLCDLLQEEGYRVLSAGDGVEGLQILQDHDPDLVLLDILMPRMDGWETCRRIREISKVPIIIVSCKLDEADIVRGLEVGADDYVTKPFQPRELLARIRAALRRGSHPIAESSAVQVDGHLCIDRAGRQVFVEGQAVDLSVTEYRLLLALLDNAGRTSTHRSLLTQVWGWEYGDETDYLKVYVHHLRQKIEPDPRNPRYILTERGLGYRFQMPGTF